MENNNVKAYQKNSALAELINIYERTINDKNSITNVYNEISAYEFKYDVKDEVIKQKADKALEMLGMSYDEYIESYKSKIFYVENSQAMTRELGEKTVDNNVDAEIKTAEDKIQQSAEPIIIVEWSESSKIENGTKLSLLEADRLFNKLDSEHDKSYYEKTKYVIKYTINGKENSYIGRYDIGDEGCGLIEHIKGTAIDYKNNPLDNNEKEQAEWVLEEFVPYLENHNLLSSLEENVNISLKELQSQDSSVKSAFESKILYYQDLKAYVENCRKELNSIPGKYHLPEAPNPQDVKYKSIEEYKSHVINEIEQEANFFGWTAEEYAANRYEPKTDLPMVKEEVKYQDNVKQEFSNENQEVSSNKKTLVINAFGGPGAGKTTACMQIAAELKKQGIIAEYVSEYAKELLHEERLDLLDGTEQHQKMILDEQYRRLGRLVGKCDIIVTDAPLLLNSTYNKELTSEYETSVRELYNKFDNFAFLVKRNDNAFQKAGRMQNLEQSKVIDTQIKEMLDRYGIRYGVYSHENIDKVVSNAVRVYKAINYDNIQNNKGVKPNNEQLSKSKEQYAADKKAELENLNAEIKKIATEYKVNPARMAELLEFASQFHKYSTKNTMLIMKQNPGATFVKSFASWKEDGYSVKRGQKGMKVLTPVKVTYLQEAPDKYVKLSEAPKRLQELYKAGQIAAKQQTYYTVGTVFDISQTNCPVEKYPEYYSMGYKDKNQDKIIEGIINYAENKLQIPVEMKSLSSISVRGTYDTVNKEISINELLKSSEKLSTLTHELGHAVMEHSKFDRIFIKAQREFEADCFSIMLDKHLGVDITESRKTHLNKSYDEMKEACVQNDFVPDIEKIIHDVFTRYNNVISDMDTYINDSLENDLNEEFDNDYGKDAEEMLQQSSVYERMVQCDEAALIANQGIHM